jgi:antitoxin (DNA-binding transcriptional repressor) of toxin-antitoxin stability system
MNASAPPATLIGAHDAKTRLSELLDRVERGEEIVITRHGRAIARLSRVTPGHDVAAARAAAEALLALGRAIAAEHGPFTPADWRELRDAGRRF